MDRGVDLTLAQKMQHRDGQLDTFQRPEGPT